MNGLRTRLGSALDARGSLRPIGIMRALFGAITVIHFAPVLREHPLPVERFHVRWWAWYPELSPTQYRALLWLGLVAGLALMVGLVCRVAAIVACVSLVATMAADIASFHHNRAFLSLMLAGLAIVPADRAWSVDGLICRRTADDDWLWPVYAPRILHSSIYLASGAGKLVDGDWFFGRALWARVRFYEANIPFGGWIYDALTSRWLWYGLAPVIVLTELVIGVGLWFRRSRTLAIALAVVFHLSIELTASVETFSLSGMAALLMWTVRPSGCAAISPESRGARSRPPAAHIA